jgi:LysM repeat protein
MLKFAPNVIKVNGVTPGKMFADSKAAPTLTQSMMQAGSLLISVAPAAGSQIAAQGELVNISLEAIAAGDAAMSFDLSNVHLVTADGRGTVLQMSPVNLVVKPTPPATKPATEEVTAAKAESSETPTPQTAAPTVTNPTTTTATPQKKQWRRSPELSVTQNRDNLWRIAAAHNVTIAALRQANPGLSGEVLPVGKRLLLPKAN